MEAARSSSRPRKEALGLHDSLESFQTLSERGMKEKTIETICTERAGCIPPPPSWSVLILAESIFVEPSSSPQA